MKIHSIHVQSYKGIEDSSIVNLGDNFTVLVGQNNAGKTALLERLAFSEQFNKPYRKDGTSVLNVPDSSRTHVRVSISGEELKWLILSQGGQAIVPLPEALNPAPDSTKRAYASTKQFLHQRFFASLSCGPNAWQPSDNVGSHVPGLHLSKDGPHNRLQSGDAGTVSSNALGSYLKDKLPIFSYVFKAERMNLDSSTRQTNLELQPNASNLAGALNHLQGWNKAQFELFNSYVNAILPSVKWVSVLGATDNPNLVTIQAWNESPNVEGTSYGHALSDCGTGTSQVLAILFAVMTSKHGRVIAIDEPSSFLHPSAVRALIQTLKLYPQHQYVISTHAPEVISAARPDTLISVRWDSGKATLSQHDGDDTAATIGALGDVGARLSDVFGFDSIIWVEGQTEAACFPEILALTGLPSIKERVGFVPIVNTGDLEGKKGVNADLAWRIYERVSLQSALMPQTIAFSLDREGRSAKAQDDLRRRSKSLVHFLSRRTFENFLIHPEAIAAVMPSVGSSKIVAKWLSDNGGDAAFEAAEQWKGDIHAIDWLESVNAPKLLTRLFSELTETKEEYRKTQHSLELTRWLVKHAPEQLAELRAYIQGLHRPADPVT